MRRPVLTAVMALVLCLAALAQGGAGESREGRLSFQIGAGPGLPLYGGETEGMLADAASYPGVERYRLGLDIGLGYGLSPSTVLLLQVFGTGDMLTDGISTMQLNLYLYGLGLRWYPDLPGTSYATVLFGATKAVLQVDGMAASATPFGSGFCAALGKELSSRATGFTVGLEIGAFGGSIGGELVGALMATANLSWR